MDIYVYVRELIEFGNKSFNSLTTLGKRELVITALADAENCDAWDMIMDHPGPTLIQFLASYSSKKMTGEQVVDTMLDDIAKRCAKRFQNIFDVETKSMEVDRLMQRRGYHFYPPFDPIDEIDAYRGFI